ILQTQLNITRTVSGITLPVRCYKVNGVEVGSCLYPDLCKILAALLPTFNAKDCPPKFLPYGIDCTCPFNIPAQLLTIVAEKLTLPDAQATVANFMATGDFVIRLDTSDTIGKFGCVVIKFTVKSQKPGK
ncbi:unnamed protein product, partial [Didymodactylos carnosus]